MRVALWLIRRLAPREWRESLAGDFEEEYRTRARLALAAGLANAVVIALTLHLDNARGLSMFSPHRHPHQSLASGLVADVRIGLRSLRRAPGYCLVALIVLTLGIGASTAMFAVADAIVLRPLPFDEPDQLVAMGQIRHDRPARGLSALGSEAPPNFYTWQASLNTLQSLGAWTGGYGFVIRDGDDPESLQALRITTNLFEILRVRPALGTGFTTQHGIDGSHRVALLSHAFWQRRFSGNPQVIGQRLTVDAGTYEILGVMPPDFGFPFGQERPADLFVPYVASALERSYSAERNFNLRAVGRLKPEFHVEDLDRELEAVAARQALEHPDYFDNRSPAALSLREATVGRVRGSMLALLGAVGVILLIACLNLANLTLARTTVRAHESSVRRALGASRWRIVRSILVEHLLLAVAGSACAVIAAWWAIAALRQRLPATLPRVSDIQIDWRVLAVAALAAIVVALVSGLVPTLKSTGRALTAKAGSAGRTGRLGRRHQGLASGIVVAEIALAVVPLVGAGLFAASFWRVATVDLGLDYRNVITTTVAPRVPSGTPADDRLALGIRAIDDVIARAQSLPGVASVAALGGGLPFSGSWTTAPMTVGQTTFDADADGVQIRRVTPDYAGVTGTALLSGRYIDEQDVPGAPLVVVLNREAVGRFFGGQDPIGQRVQLSGDTRTIIGVVDDVRVSGPEVPVSPQAYFPLAQAPSSQASVLVRTTGDPRALIQDVRRVVLDVVPGVPVDAVTLESELQDLITGRELNMMLTGVFAFIALGIVAVGIYGVMAYTVAQRRQEIGVRMALGATPAGVLRMIVRRAVSLIGVGLLVGGVAAWLLAESVRAFLFQVQPTSPIVFATAALVLTLAGLCAAIVPALRAARVDPTVAIR